MTRIWLGLGICAAAVAVVGSAEAQQQQVTGLPVLVRVGIDSRFRTEYEREVFYDGDGLTRSERTPSLSDMSPREVQQGLLGELKKRLESHNTGGIVRHEFLDSDSELKRKMERRQGYMCLFVELEKRKLVKGDTSKFELSADVEIRRLAGTEWISVVKTSVKSEGARSGDRTDMANMAAMVDALMMRNIVTCQPMGSVAKTGQTRIIRIRLQNPTRYDVIFIEWKVSDGKTTLSATSEGRLKPGAVADVDIEVTSELSHAAIQWRDVRIGEIKFANPSN